MTMPRSLTAGKPQTPERWQRAIARAVKHGVEVRRVNSSGLWIATSATQEGVAYELQIVDGTVQSCSCPAGQFGESVCLHKAAYYLAVGKLSAPDAEVVA